MAHRRWHYMESNYKILDSATQMTRESGHWLLGVTCFTPAPTTESMGLGIWRSNTGNSGTWSHVVSGGNGNSTNYICTGFHEFNGHLYTAVENESTWAHKSGVQPMA